MDAAWDSRTELLVGAAGIQRLRNASVAVFGLGGVGGYAAEAIARAGVGHITLVDFDIVDPTNRNRQLLALRSTEGRKKVEVARERMLDINPDADVRALAKQVDEDNAAALLEGVKYLIDAIDQVRAKAALLETAYAAGLQVVSCMGAASKLSPAGVRVADISETEQCPLARKIRLRLRKAGIHTGIRCVYSQENTRIGPAQEPAARPRVRGAISYVPGLVGLTAAGVVVNEILGLPGPPRTPDSEPHL